MEISVEFIRVPYNIDETVDAIRSSDLPSEFADQLRAGGAIREPETAKASKES
jgi:hypothetical protein